MNMENLFGWATSAESLPIGDIEGATLQSLDHRHIAEIGRRFLIELAKASSVEEHCPSGLLNIPVNGMSQLMNAVPGLRTLDADAMNAADVARIADYLLMKKPRVFDAVLNDLNEAWPAATDALRAIREGASGN
jgi:hypothetical protein